MRRFKFGSAHVLGERIYTPTRPLSFTLPSSSSLPPRTRPRFRHRPSSSAAQTSHDLQKTICPEPSPDRPDPPAMSKLRLPRRVHRSNERVAHLLSPAVMTVSAPVPSPFNPSAARPRVSSPLAASAQPRSVSSRPHAFPTSRPLRPFPSIAVNHAKSSARKPVKMIEPPANFKTAFVLNLTQAELSRQD
ncbi:hypothetical protein BD413DRAFT_127284 [Trametes elegans]|nr:hypothetical protein BD413DRAFT_127284 [Trametes elegans]